MWFVGAVFKKGMWLKGVLLIVMKDEFPGLKRSLTSYSRSDTVIFTVPAVLVVYHRRWYLSTHAYDC